MSGSPFSLRHGEWDGEDAWTVIDRQGAPLAIFRDNADANRFLVSGRAVRSAGPVTVLERPTSRFSEWITVDRTEAGRIELTVAAEHVHEAATIVLAADEARRLALALAPELGEPFERPTDPPPAPVPDLPPGRLGEMLAMGAARAAELADWPHSPELAREPSWDSLRSWWQATFPESPLDSERPPPVRAEIVLCEGRRLLLVSIGSVKRSAWWP